MTQRSTILGRRPAFRPARVGVVAAALAGTLVLAACSDTGNDGTQIGVSTPRGLASVSLDKKQVPKHWPSNEPVPSGAKLDGSASFAGESNGPEAGVYRSDKSPEQVYAFYTGGAVTAATKSSAGSGSHFLGQVRITSPLTEDISIVPYKGGSLIVMVLSSVHGPSTTPTTTPEGSSGRE